MASGKILAFALLFSCVCAFSQHLQDKYFSWKSWANFADAGEKPQ